VFVCVCVCVFVCVCVEKIQKLKLFDIGKNCQKSSRSPITVPVYYKKVKVIVLSRPAIVINHIRISVQNYLYALYKQNYWRSSVDFDVRIWPVIRYFAVQCRSISATGMLRGSLGFGYEGGLV